MISVVIVDVDWWMNNLTVMFTVKKAVKSVVEKDQRRILAVSLAHNGKLIVKGDD